MDKLCIRDDDLSEKFIRASGKGGQKINKSSVCVFLKHLPTGMTVKCAQSRLQSDNRFLARRILADKIEQERKGKESELSKKIYKLRKQKRRRSKKAKEKILKLKKINSEKKRLRIKPQSDEI